MIPEEIVKELVEKGVFFYVAFFFSAVVGAWYAARRAKAKRRAEK